MRIMIRLILNGVFWIAVSLVITGVIVNIFGIYFIPYMSLIVAVTGVAFPQIIDMGVDKYMKANIYEKSFPILVVGIILFVSRWFTPTIVVACVNSYYLGVSTSYISKVLTEKLERRR